MSESEDDENFGIFNFEDILTELQIISIPKLKKKMTFFFLIRLIFVQKEKEEEKCREFAKNNAAMSMEQNMAYLSSA